MHLSDPSIPLLQSMRDARALALDRIVHRERARLCDASSDPWVQSCVLGVVHEASVKSYRVSHRALSSDSFSYFYCYDIACVDRVKGYILYTAVPVLPYSYTVYS